MDSDDPAGDRGPAAGGVTGAVARATVALRWVVVAAWLAAVAAAIIYLPSMGGAGTLEPPLPDDAAPLSAERRAADAFGYPLISRTQVIVRDPEGLTVDEQAALAEFALRVTSGGEEGFAEVRAVVPVPNGVAPGARERDTAVLHYLLIDPSASIPLQVTLAERYAGAAPAPAGATVGVTGSTPSRDQQLQTVRDRLPLIVGVTLALIVLVVAIVLRSLAAPLVVLGVVGVAWVLAMRVIGWVAEFTGMSAGEDVEPVVSALLIGIVTDYAIFYLFGMRSRLREAGDDRAGRRTAAVATGAHYMAIVLTAGVTTALGTGALLVGRLDFFRAFAPALALTAVVAVLVSVTLLPALLALLGRIAYWPRGVGAAPDPAAGARDDGPGRARGPLGARLISTRPVAALVAVAVLAGLGLAGWQLTDLRLGLGLDSGISAAAGEVDAGFAPGYRAPTELLLEGPGAGDAEALEGLGGRLRDRPEIVGAIGPGDPSAEVLEQAFTDDDADLGRFLVVLRPEPTEHRAIAALEALQRDMPGLLARAGLPDVTASWAGDTAIAESAVDAVAGEFVRVGAVALLVNLLLLVLFLRALVAPLYLLVANVASMGATLGLATVVFQDWLGHGQLVYYVPFAAAVLLLALGSDYNIYLMGQIWRLARGRGVHEGLRRAIPLGSRPIAVAGFVLAGSFGLLALVPMAAMRQFAFIMGVGALIDAFVVRTLLVPAFVTLFGKAGFWPGRPPEEPRETSAEGRVPAAADT